MGIEKKIEEGKSLKSLNTWRVGGHADYFLSVSHQGDVLEAQNWCQSKKIPMTVIGGGSNVLVSDKGIRGLVLSLENLNRVEEEKKDGALVLRVEAGALKAQILKAFLKHKLTPALFLAGLPGQAAGGIVMNAGVGSQLTPHEFGEIVKDFSVLKEDGSVKVYQHDEVEWSYRKTSGWQPGVILSMTLSWPYQPSENIMEELKTVNRRRIKTQPIEKPSCGSVFTNPVGQHAGALIDSLGLKGHSIGKAQVSKKHANFIVTEPEAKAEDVYKLILFVQDSVLKATQFKLKPEVVFLGEWV